MTAASAFSLACSLTDATSSAALTSEFISGTLPVLRFSGKIVYVIKSVSYPVHPYDLGFNLPEVEHLSAVLLFQLDV